MKVTWRLFYYSRYVCIYLKISVIKIYFLNVHVAEQFMTGLWITSRQTQNLDYSSPIKML